MIHQAHAMKYAETPIITSTILHQCNAMMETIPITMDVVLIA